MMRKRSSRWNGLWGPLGIETSILLSLEYLYYFCWNGLWGPLGIETPIRIYWRCGRGGWNGLWGPLGIETAPTQPSH